VLTNKTMEVRDLLVKIFSSESIGRNRIHEANQVKRVGQDERVIERFSQQFVSVKMVRINR